MSPQDRRALLKPLVRRKANPASGDTLSDALDRLDKRAFANAHVPGLAAMMRAARENRTPSSRKDPEAARLSIAFARTMFMARRISEQEYVFLAAIAAEQIHDSRIQDRAYPELEDVERRIDLIRQRHGLTDDQYWSAGDGPREYRDLCGAYDSICQRRFVETLNEFDLHDIASLVQSDPNEFERRRERGRRAFFHDDEMVPALTDIVVRYETDARKAASVGAYSAAITLLGAAVEGLLLLRCLRSSRKAQKVAASLPAKKRPRKTGDPTAWTFDVLIDICMLAGWLPEVPTQLAILRPDALAHILRRMRNYVHPGRVAKERPWIEADEHEYNDAEAIYTTLFATVSRPHARRKLQDVAQMPLIPTEDVIGPNHLG